MANIDVIKIYQITIAIDTWLTPYCYGIHTTNIDNAYGAYILHILQATRFHI